MESIGCSAGDVRRFLKSVGRRKQEVTCRRAKQLDFSRSKTTKDTRPSGADSEGWSWWVGVPVREGSAAAAGKQRTSERAMVAAGRWRLSQRV